MHLQTPETRRRMRIGSRFPYGGPPRDLRPGWPVEYPTNGLEHEFFRDDAEPVAVNREPTTAEIAYVESEEN